MLGNKIYYIDVASNTVNEGIICGESVNTEGHAVYSIKDGDMYLVHFKSLCFENKEDAEKALPEAYGLNQEIKQIQIEANKRIDELLVRLHGEPQYKNLTIDGESVAE